MRILRLTGGPSAGADATARVAGIDRNHRRRAGSRAAAPGSALSAPPGSVGDATFGRRAGAYLIDAIPSLIISGLAYALFFSAVVGRSADAANASLILLLVGPLAYFVVLWAMAAKGSSPGNAILGIRVVRESGGGEPGAGLGLGRSGRFRSGRGSIERRGQEL